MTAAYAMLDPGWIRRYDVAVEELKLTAVDYSNITIKPLESLGEKSW